MTEAVSILKDEKKVAAGRAGARSRWQGTDRRVVRLDDLTPNQRRLVLTLIDAARAQQEQAA